MRTRKILRHTEFGCEGAHEVPAKTPAAAKAASGRWQQRWHKICRRQWWQRCLHTRASPLSLSTLSGDQGQRHLRLVVQVEVRGELSKDELDKHLPEVRNRLIFWLTQQNFCRHR